LGAVVVDGTGRELGRIEDLLIDTDGMARKAVVRPLGGRPAFLDLTGLTRRENGDGGFGADVSLHTDRAEFVLSVTVPAGTKSGRQSMVAEARYQACTATICLPPQTDTVKVPVTIK
jgi:hypothetical protein